MVDTPNASGVALVTGAGSGIGRATCLRLAHRGDAICAFDVAPEAAARTAELVEGEGARAVAVAGDVRSAADLERAVGAARQLGTVTSAVANAGIEMIGTVLETSEERWQQALGVMLTGTFLTARATLPDLIEARGSFVAVASDAGLAGFQSWAAYVAAKHGVVGLVRAMALDHGPHGVRVNAVCPGPTLTPMNDRVLAGVPPEQAARYELQVPLGRHAAADDVAAAIAHLTSDEARHTNGLAYVVDGGSHAGRFEPDEAAGI
jgi:NAD(P)-dependent dehydrogenase (short-subunit alcohol dehydrogenase family)